ncbi:MAG: helix-turn-helix domain-containing protein [Fimbriimonadaceae bacterium]|nr:helix-turn-helix domain-containing protein [Fimbriimonadaceae bacterium]QYK54958.1 MAG: helix-turn-helix domain-containing protein [Fimbriimonadaceae bacterium]
MSENGENEFVLRRYPSFVLDPGACYAAILAHDRRFDGVFFTGVVTTGIYCRPVCPVRPPKPENCTFYRTAAEAEAHGFRPCLRCRPELAPGRSDVEAVGRLAASARLLIENGFLDEGSLADLADALGVTPRHLLRAVRREYGVRPIDLAQTRRLLTAKRLLTDTDLPVGEVALASGFKSLRRFNDLFATRYRLKPTEIRRGKRPRAETLTCRLRCREPFEWERMLAFFSARALSGIEVVGQAYSRTVSIAGATGWVRLERTEPGEVQVAVSATLASVLQRVLGRIRYLFDLEADVETISKALGGLAADFPGLRVPGSFDPFETAVRIVVGQQVSVAGARTIANRMAARYGEPVETGEPGLDQLFPSPATIAELDPAEIQTLGMPHARAKTIQALAAAVESGDLDLRPHRDPEASLAALSALPGIGPWTVQLIAMRCLGWPDAFPASDLGVLRALGLKSAAECERLAESWRPWRSYALMHLWNMK